MATLTQVLTESQLSAAAFARLRKPLHRGTFRDLDAARAQLGLLSVADSSGQARIYWLIDLNTQVIEDARFLAFGGLASHPVADCWSDMVRGQSIQQACETPLAEIEATLRDDEATPAFGEAELEPLAFISELQQLALAELPQVKVLPKPVEVERYQRKREADWDDQDRTWLPLSLMKKVMRAQSVAEQAIASHFDHAVAWSIEGLHDDFQVVIDFTGTNGEPIPVEQQPTVVRMLEEALRSDIHPAITVTERAEEQTS